MSDVDELVKRLRRAATDDTYCAPAPGDARDMASAAQSLEQQSAEIEAKDVEWRLQEELKDRAMARGDKLLAALKEIAGIADDDEAPDCLEHKIARAAIAEAEHE